MTRRTLLYPTLLLCIACVLAGCPKSTGSSDDPQTYTVTYDANGATGGSAPADAGAYEEGATVTVKGNGSLFKAGYGAIGWNTAPDGSGTSYAPVASFAMGKADVKLYARWGQWKVLGSAGFSNQAYYTCLAFDRNGVPYVAYQDTANSSKVSVMKYDGAAWVQVGAAGFSAGGVPRGCGVDLAVSASGVPYVAFGDGSNSGRASVMKYDGAGATGWSLVGSAGISADSAGGVSLALDASGVPYVAYGDAGNGSKIDVMKFSGSSWILVGSAGLSTGATAYTSLAFGGGGVPYVAFMDLGNGGKASVMKYEGSTWVQVGSVGFSAGDASYLSLALDSKSIPYLAYMDYAVGSKACVMKYDGSGATGWIPVGAAGVSPGKGSDTSLAIDPYDTPCVAYTDEVNGYKASALKFDGSSWVQVGAVGFSAAEAYFPSLAFDPSGIPFVAYSDNGSGRKSTVMRLAP